MRMLSLISTLLLVGSTAVTAGDADLSKIDRTIGKEPVYKSKPMYCLLVFGPEAKTRVWLVLDGETLYVDRNGNGNLTEDGARLEPHQKAAYNQTAPGAPPRMFQHWFKVSDIATADRKTKVGSLKLYFWGPAKDAVHENPCVITVGAQRADDVQFAGRTAAPILHFAGPLTFRLYEPFEPAHFVLGQEPRPSNLKDSNWLMVRAGTPGLGNGPTFVGFIHDDTRKKNQNLEAQADIDFPCKDGLTKRISVKLTDT